MAYERQIMCINKSDRNDEHERIRRVGGVLPDGTSWNWALDEAILADLRGDYKFYASVNGKSVWVDVVESASGNKYLKTRGDGQHENNLLSLPEC